MKITKAQDNNDNYTLTYFEKTADNKIVTQNVFSWQSFDELIGFNCSKTNISLFNVLGDSYLIACCNNLDISQHISCSYENDMHLSFTKLDHNVLLAKAYLILHSLSICRCLDELLIKMDLLGL